MKELNWQQTDKIVIGTVEVDERIIKFSIENRIINNLINHTPRVYFFKLNYEGKEYDFIANFNELKPIVRKSSKLSVKVKTEKKIDNKSILDFGFYTIARGESFMERFMGIKGWQTQEYNFKLVLLDEKNKPEKTETPKVDNPIKKEQHTSTIVESENKSTNVEPTNFKCEKCGHEITTDLDVCPSCFNLLIPLEKDVDFTI